MAGPDLHGLPPAAQAAFAALQQQFRAGLGARWAALEAATSPQEQAQVLHKLAGAAGSYGEAELSQAAKLAEQLVLRGDPAALAEALARLHALMLPRVPTSAHTPVQQPPSA